MGVGENYGLWPAESIHQIMMEIHAREVLILENKTYYGSIQEESAYKQYLREEITELYQVEPVKDIIKM
ncbi:MAG: hypothetical protein RR614_10470, partial [Eubacterium sp.]